MLQTFKVHFMLKVEKTNRKGLAPIIAKVRLNETKVEISTKRTNAKANYSCSVSSLLYFGSKYFTRQVWQDTKA